MSETSGNATDNQQAIALVAGLYLGEGHFSLTHQNNCTKETGQVRTEVGFANQDPALLECVVTFLDRIGVSNYVTQNASNCLQVKVQRHGDILRLIEVLEPYLIGNKKAQAAILKRYVLRRIAKRGTHVNGMKFRVDDEDLSLVREMTKERESSETMSMTGYAGIAR